jgi:hypothetical protein
MYPMRLRTVLLVGLPPALGIATRFVLSLQHPVTRAKVQVRRGRELARCAGRAPAPVVCVHISEWQR